MHEAVRPARRLGEESDALPGLVLLAKLGGQLVTLRAGDPGSFPKLGQRGPLRVDDLRTDLHSASGNAPLEAHVIHHTRSVAPGVPASPTFPHTAPAQEGATAAGTFDLPGLPARPSRRAELSGSTSRRQSPQSHVRFLTADAARRRPNRGWSAVAQRVRSGRRGPHRADGGPPRPRRPAPHGRAEPGVPALARCRPGGSPGQSLPCWCDRGTGLVG